MFHLDSFSIQSVRSLLACAISVHAYAYSVLQKKETFHPGKLPNNINGHGDAMITVSTDGGISVIFLRLGNTERLNPLFFFV